MKKLSYETLTEQGYDGFLCKEAPERVLQFGQGNFLRAFVEDFIDEMNEKAGFAGKVVVVQSGRDSRARFTSQDCLYTLILRGKKKGQMIDQKRIISAISRVLHATEDFDAYLDCAKNPDLRFIVSNTTEAGIVYDPACAFTDRPASSFPGKLTQLLYARFQSGLPGFILLPCELIDDNGRELERCVMAYARQWELGDDFVAWLEKENVFCSTLVDRIVPGYPKAQAMELWEELGYEDDILDEGEVFGAWVIEGPKSLKEELPFQKASLPISVVDDVVPYKHRKVRILNGAHSSFALGAYLAGFDIVRDCMEDETIAAFLDKTLQEEVIPTLNLPREDLEEFASAVRERFSNPFIDHQLLSISLNSVAKWRARCLPSLLEYSLRHEGKLPSCLTFSLACLAEFYRRGTKRGEGCLLGKRGEDTYKIEDDAWVLDFFYEHSGDDVNALAKAMLGDEQLWGEDLLKVSGLEEAFVTALKLFEEKGMYAAMAAVAGGKE